MNYKIAVKEFHRLKGIEVRKNARLLGIDGIRHTCKKDYECIDHEWTESQCCIIWVVLKDSISGTGWTSCIFCIYRVMTSTPCTLCTWAVNHGGPCGLFKSEYRKECANPVDQVTREAYEKILKKIERRAYD